LSIFKQIKLKTKQTVKETARVITENSAIARGFFINSREKAPITSGINMRNENFTAFSLSIPKNSEVEMVIPLLETPGSKAIACMSPMKKTLPLFSSYLEALKNLDEKTTIPVKRKNKDISK